MYLKGAMMVLHHRAGILYNTNNSNAGSHIYHSR